MNEIYIVDRSEGEYVILENELGDSIDVNKSLVENGVKEGDCLRKIGNYFKIDKEETEKRKKKIAEMMKGMWVD